MSEDFSTLSVRGAERAREIEVLRQHYRRHRDALARMIADSPTETLANEYRRLTAEIDRAIAKLDEIERGVSAAPPAPAPEPEEAPWSTTAPHGDPLRGPAEPGMRPLARPQHEFHDYEQAAPAPSSGGNRVLLILLAAVVALSVLGWIIWRASSGRDEAPVTAAPAGETIVEPVTATEPIAPPAILAVSPAGHDYGVVRKGTRATRRFEVTNQSEEPVTIQIARSECRCLYYVYDSLIPPKATQAVTVTIDGAKAQAGALRESVAITSKSNPDVSGTLDVTATVR